MTDPTAAERVLFVHAHPDDETLSTGGTIAKLVDAGAHVTLLTLTRGEQGEVIAEDLAHLAADPDALGDHRETELAEAAATLGIRDHRILGQPGARLAGRQPRRYRDSGMVWLSEGQDAVAGPLDDVDPESLLAADYGELVTDVATVVADVAPTAIVSYDANGGYGHPDHVLAHDAASHAAEVLGVPFYEIVTPRSATQHGDGLIRVDVTGVLDRKRAALAAHRSQLTIESDTVTHPGGQRHEIGSVELFARRLPVDAGAPAEPSTGVKAAALILAALAGVAVAALGTTSHQILAPTDGGVGVGTIASILLVALTLGGLRLISRTRTLALAAGVPLVLVVAAMITFSPGGSVLVPDNAAGVAWAYGAPLIAAVIIGWPRIERYDGGSRVKGRASA